MKRTGTGSHIPLKILGISLAFGGLFWIMDAIFLGYENPAVSFFNHILPTDSGVLIFRLLILVLFIGTGYHIHRSSLRQEKVRKQLEQAVYKANILTEFSRDFIFIVDRNDTVQYVNSFGAAAWGKQPEDLIGKPRSELFPPQVAQRQKQGLQFVFDTGQSRSFEGKNIFPEGEKWLNTLLVPVKDAAGDTTAVIGISRDITARTTAEEALRESETRFREISETLPEAIFEADTAGRITYSNPTGLEMFGYRPEELATGIWISNAMIAEDRPRVKETFGRLLQGQAQPLHEYTGLKKNGTTFPIAIHSRPITRNGTVIGVRGFLIDLTESRKNQEKYQALVEQINDGLYILNPDGYFTFVNKIIEKRAGKPAEWFYKTHYLDPVVPEHRDRAREAFERVLRGEHVEPYEFTYRPDPERTITIEVNAHPIYENGKIVGILGISRDITERRQMEQALRTSEARYRAIVEDQMEFITRFLPDGTVTFVNGSACRYYGKPAAEIVGHSFLPFVAEQDRSRVFESLQALTPENPVATIENQVRGSDGTIKWTQWTNRAFFGPNGKPVEYQSVGRDITERKQAEEALRKSESRLRHLFNSDIIGMGIATTDGWIREANTKLLDIVGYARENLPLNWKKMTPPEWAERDEMAIKDLLSRGVSGPTEKEYFRKDGARVPVLLGAVLLKPSGETFIFLLDLTDRKKAERELRSNKEFIEVAINSQPDTFFVYELKTGQPLRWNKTFRDISGYSDQEIQAMKAPDDFYGTDDLNKAQAAVQTLLSCGSATIEMSLITKSGRTIPTEYTGALIRDNQRNPLYVIAIGRDITERKRIEEALRNSEQQYTTTIEALVDPVHVLDAQMNFVLTNTAYRKFMIPHGLPENPTGKNLFDTFPNLPPFVPEEYRRVFDTGKTLVTEEIIAAGGRDCIFEVRKIPILLAGKVHRVMTVFHDITEHKIMEKQIRRYSEQLEQEVLRRMERIRELERRQREDEKLAAAGRMAARIAHEINNPLAGIKNAFQLIKGAVPESHPYFHYVGLIEKEINRIARIIQQMFGLYRPEPEMIREFRPDQSIREVAALMETTCQDSRVAIRVAVADALPAVHLSEGLIRQVLFNLIKNAIEVSPPGGEITVGAKTEAQTMVLTVADQGPGIPEDIRARIFDPFFTTKTGSNAPGLGLGLYISKSIVEFLRGTIECHCPPGKGTTFRVVLPLIAKERENEPWPKAEES